IHEQNNIGLQQRCQGVKEGFGGTVTNTQVKGTADIATTQTEIRSKLQSDKSYDAVIALNPDIASAAATAIKGAGSKAKLATFDLTPGVIKNIKAGSVLFAVDQQQYLQGYLPIVFLKLYKTNANTVCGGQRGDLLLDPERAVPQARRDRQLDRRRVDDRHPGGRRRAPHDRW